MSKKPRTVKMDQETLDELAAVFTWAQIVVDAQMLDEAAEEMQYVMSNLSEHFGLEYTVLEETVDVTELDDPNGSSYLVRMKQKQPFKPSLVWTNDQPDKPGLKIVDKDYDESKIVETNDNDSDEPEPPKLA